MEIPIGTEIELGGRRYRVEARLGGGSQGQVFRGVSDTGEVVALKYITDPRRRHREADILDGWKNDHIVRLYQHGPWAGGELLVMDLVNGLTLQRIQELCEHLKRGIHPALAIDLITQVAQGLEEGYSTLRLKVHRDIKPSNVMLQRDGLVKILDFGIAYGLDLTITGTPVATPLYMAPEQMEGARPAETLDHRTDQYSLALLLCELLLGKPLRPLDRDSLARWLFVPGAEWTAARERIYRQAPETLPALERMLAWEPERRFNSMADAVVVLLEIRSKMVNAPSLEGFAERIMAAYGASRVLPADDPAFVLRCEEGHSLSETLLPDDGDSPFPPPSAGPSPLAEREIQGPLNLARLKLPEPRVQRSAERTPRMKMTPALDRLRQSVKLAPMITGRSTRELANALGGNTPQRRIALAAVGVLLILGVVAGLAALTSDYWAAGDTTRPQTSRGVGVYVTPAPAPGSPSPEFSAPVVTSTPHKMKVVPPVGTPSPDGSTPPFHAGGGSEDGSPSKGGTSPSQDWRRQVPGVGEPLPSHVINGSRPGEDLHDN